MKTILHIAIILVFAAAVAGALTLIVNNSSLSSGMSTEGGQRPEGGGNGQVPAFGEGTGQQNGQGMSRPEGGEGPGNAGRSWLGVLTVVAKVAGVTLVIWIIRNIIDLVKKNRKNKPLKVSL